MLTTLKDIPIKSTAIKGPWFSLGFHIDFQRRYIDLHVIWWIVTIGQDYYDDTKGKPAIDQGTQESGHG